MRAEIISIGTELLLGEIIDTNAAWLAQQLAAAGVDVFFRTTVGDNVGRIAAAIQNAMSRAEIIITTGGLGPTVDDMTRQAVAQAVGAPLVLDPELLAQVRERFAKWGRAPSENNVRQAYMPQGATPVENPVGTAPCFIVEHQGHSIFVLPGVPREMKHLTETRVLPWLREKLGDDSIILSKTLRTCAIGESSVDEKIQDLETSENPTVGLAAHPGQTDIRITAKAKTRAAAEKLIADMEARVRARMGEWIYGEGDETIAQVVARLLTAKQKTIAVAESNTQGKIAAWLRSTPEAIDVAEQLVRVTDDEVNDQTARSIAKTLRAESGADIVLAIVSTMGAQDMYLADTGKSVIALAANGKTRCYTYSIGGTGELAQHWTASRALDLVRRALL
ncbi:MAG: CinA family nicotinamide mononucleotide deamidase-related protein [Chloroflexi bacterium]|nr:CinA family nicotinamide mononucleotide deamidase-related protein [Chloroflexota bacterium]